MAEAAVEERPVQKFYCHMCNVSFESTTTTFTCPHCSDGFVEELFETPENNDVEMEDLLMDDLEEEGISYRDFFTGLQAFEDRRSGRSRSLDGNRTGRRRPTTGARPNMPFENFIQDVIINLGVNWGNTANMQLFLGNPGDYAWGREGLDAIITQLLNQMDSTGPPPVSKDTIDALPTVEITKEQVDKKLQCSVCWEDFTLKEMVRQLPCQHVYHEPCIRPWLELHGTCPICRQNLGDNNADTQPQPANVDNNQEGSVSGAGNVARGAIDVLRSLYRRRSNTDTSTSPSTSDYDFLDL